ncbi:hypothetical protein EI94DRAFT_1786163, partial [Lactarius quietus]
MEQHHDDETLQMDAFDGRHDDKQYDSIDTVIDQSYGNPTSKRIHPKAVGYRTTPSWSGKAMDDRTSEHPLKHPVVGAPSRRPRKPRSSTAGNFLDPLACVRTTSTTTSPPKRDHPRAGLHKPHRHHCVHERIPHRIHSSVWVHKGLTLEI